jgi:ADP-ribosyl-[dinitrogen reductase] hydrolase
MFELNASQIHRAAGVLLAQAAGDALGAGHEFGPPLADDVHLAMTGGGGFGWAPGEWTDDTDMSLVIATALADGLGLSDAATLDRLAAGWWQWANQSKDVGVQTRRVLAAAGATDGGAPGGVSLLAASEALHEKTGQTAGNGSLMRTAPVALAHLDSAADLAEAAYRVSELTHFDPDAGNACVLWCLAIRHAVLTGELDIRVGLSALTPEAAATWLERIEVAEASVPADFTRNGWVVEALQGAWSAIHTTRDEGDVAADHLRLGLEAAVRGGGDTDTVAAIAGGLLGAAYGASAVPLAWKRVLHGWPDLRARDLVHLGVLIATGGAGDSQQWPTEAVFDYDHWGPETRIVATHPHDPGVILGGVNAVRHLPDGVDAVVSLCRLGLDEVPAVGIAPENHVEVWLVDKPDPILNPHLEFVLADVASVIASLRAEGRTVLVHCVGSKSRTPTASILHSMTVAGLGFDDALAALRQVVPTARPNAGFEAALRAGVPLPSLSAVTQTTDGGS